MASQAKSSSIIVSTTTVVTNNVVVVHIIIITNKKTIIIIITNKKNTAKQACYKVLSETVLVQCKEKRVSEGTRLCTRILSTWMKREKQFKSTVLATVISTLTQWPRRPWSISIIIEPV